MPQRGFTEEDQQLFERYRRSLASRDRPYVTIRGDFEERMLVAYRAIDRLL